MRECVAGENLQRSVLRLHHSPSACYAEFGVSSHTAASWNRLQLVGETQKTNNPNTMRRWDVERTQFVDRVNEAGRLTHHSHNGPRSSLDW